MTVERIRVDGNENCDNFPVGMRVLAVDDNPICLKLLETLLRKCQYHVTTTSQARMALKMLCENRDRFDLVISDVHMPDMDGFKLLELVGLEMDLPVIMLSANSDPKLVLKGVTHGACDYLVKPVRIEELRNIWQHVVRRKKDSKKQNSSPDQVKGNWSGGEGNDSPMAGNAEKNGKFNRKRKEEEDESEDNRNEGKDPSSEKKPQVVWSIELHRKFVATVNQLGIDKAVPKRILDLMNVEVLTRENVASHLQKYRLYLRRISSGATQQANMVATLGVKNSPFIRMGLYEGFADFRSLVGQGRHGNPSLSPYSVGGMLGRLNSSANLNIHNITPPHLVPAGSHSQNATALGKMHPVLPSANQNPSLFQAIPSSLELDQLQQNKGPSSIMNFNPLDDSRIYTSSNAFNDPGAILRSTSNMLNAIPGNPVMLQGTANLQQTPSGGGFGNQSSHSVASFNLDSFNASVNGSSTLLDPGSVEISKMQQSPILTTEPFHSQMAVSSGRENGFLSGPYISNNSIDVSSALPLEVPREMQFQESLVGNAQNIVQTPSQWWGEQGQNYSHASKSNFTFLGTRVTDSAVPLLNQNLDVYENSNGFPVGLRVLAVDDDPICLKVLGILLRKCQYHVTTMNQASMALKTLWKNRDRFDLVIQNVHMLEMDGFRFLELVCFEMDLPVIMLSANNDPKLVLKGLTHGARDYLIKPVRIEELRNIWQHVIRGTRLNLSEGDDTSTQRKPRVIWSVEVHRKFVSAVNQLGIENVVPKKILDLMNVEGLTRENVASHLQKYRLYLRRIHRASNAFNDPGTIETPKMQHSPILSTETFHSQLDVPLLNQNMDPEKGLFNQRIEMFAVKRISRKGSILAYQGDEVWESGCWMKARNHLQTLKTTNVPSKLMMFLILSCFCLFMSFLVFYGFCPMVG